MQKLDVWHIVWVLLLVIGVLLLAATLVIALNHRENSTFANFSSIWGLSVSLIGFVITIYTLFETQHVARRAQREVQNATIEVQRKIEDAAKQAQEAVKNAQEQIRQLLDTVPTRRPRRRLFDATYVGKRAANIRQIWRMESSPSLGRRMPRSG